MDELACHMSHVRFVSVSCHASLVVVSTTFYFLLPLAFASGTMETIVM